MNTNYQSAILRINKAASMQQLMQLDKSMLNLYNAGELTEKEYQRLDIKIIDKLTTLESEH